MIGSISVRPPPLSWMRRLVRWGQRVNQVVVDAVDRIEPLGHLKDLGQRLTGKDGPLLDLQHDLERIRPADLFGIFVMGLDELVILRQLFVKTGEQIELEGKGGKDQRRHGYNAQDDLAPRDPAVRRGGTEKPGLRSALFHS